MTATSTAYPLHAALDEAAPLRAAIYVRISDDKVGAGVGVANQEADCRALGVQLGVVVVGVYVDNDMSATSGAPRPQYDRMLADIRAGLIDVVLVWHTDRLHRQPIELEQFIKAAECRTPPVNVHPVKVGLLDLATPAGRMVARMLAATAKYEIDMKVARQKESNKHAALKGLPRSTTRAFGFEDDKITHRPEEADRIREAAHAILAGGSLRSIALRWNDAGILTVPGNPWTTSSLRQMLLRPRNAGKRAHNDVIVADAVWEPIIDFETWKALGALLNDPARKNGPGPTPRWLLSGIAECGYVDENGTQCDYTVKIGMDSEAARRGRPSCTKYVCRGHGHISRAAADSDAFIRRVVVARLSQPDALKLLREEKHVDLTALHEQARELRGRQKALALQAAKGTIDDEMLATINQSIRADLDLIEGQIAEASQGSVLEGLIGVKDVEATWDALSLDRRRQIVDTLMRVTFLRAAGRGRSAFSPETVRIEWRSPGAPRERRKRGNHLKPATLRN